MDQFAAFLDVLPQIDAVLAEKGETIPRPKYDIRAQKVEEEDERDDNGGNEEKAKRKNHEATSDEEDE